MKKETYYFSHDYHARNDRKLVKVRLKYRMLGIGIYWSIIEMLYEENGQILLSEIPTISQDLREKEIIVKSILSDFELFENDTTYFWSNSVKRRLDKRLDKTNKAIESARERWRKANAMRTHSDGNAIKRKEKKVNEKKKSIGDKSPDTTKSFKLLDKTEFYNQVAEFKNEYPKDLLRDFYNYWSEESAGGKMKFQLKETWQTNLRIKRWSDNANNSIKPPAIKNYETPSGPPIPKVYAND